MIGDPKTRTSKRTILLPDVLLEHRTKQKEARLKAGQAWQNLDFVFCSRHGKQLWPDNVRSRFYRMLQRAGLPRMRFHDLRHSPATLMRSMGVDLKVIQEILGHSTMDMTFNVYSHTLPLMQKDAAEKMKKLFDSPS
ncbi:site-specific integrase [Ktedonosporobacter rubrisoli]|uniref:site-specific integrase n=1 Tax=Ktedonosporobacter rubrisoli TaxID=2509675 RepID=UPI0013EE69DC|nr:site-specific integrase [Ktedonosporobacter rubrisoli]